jgi:hypothetical protein
MAWRSRGTSRTIEAIEHLTIVRGSPEVRLTFLKIIAMAWAKQPETAAACHLWLASEEASHTHIPSHNPCGACLHS